MEYSEKQLNGFFESVESLKKYRRADLIDENGRDLLKELYTDLLPNDYILKKSLKENTTFLIGRKGTGKSTIFLRIEQELREKKGYLPCYLDVKTIYESSQTKLTRIKGVDSLLPSDILEKYLIERSFIQTILSKIIDEISNKFDSLFDKLLRVLGVAKVESIQERLLELKSSIEDNNHLEKIEIPVLQTYSRHNKGMNERIKESNLSSKLELNSSLEKTKISGGIKADVGMDIKKSDKIALENEDSFSSVFLQVFQIKEVITGIKEALAIVNPT